MVFIGLTSTSLQPLSPTSWLPSTPQPFPCRVRAKRAVVAVPKKSLVTIILVRSPSNFIFTQFGCLLTASKRKKLKTPNFIFLTKWGGCIFLGRSESLTVPQSRLPQPMSSASLLSFLFLLKTTIFKKLWMRICTWQKIVIYEACTEEKNQNIKRVFMVETHWKYFGNWVFSNEHFDWEREKEREREREREREWERERK